MTLAGFIVELLTITASYHFYTPWNAFTRSLILPFVVLAFDRLADTLASMRVLNKGRVKADNLILAFAGASGTVPIMKFTAFCLYFACTLANGVVVPLVLFVSAFADVVAFATASFRIEVSSCVFCTEVRTWAR